MNLRLEMECLREASSSLVRRATVAAVTMIALAAGLPAVSEAQASGEPAASGGSFTLQQVLDYPFATGLAASPKSSRIAWVIEVSGVRNIWTAEGPDFKAYPLTAYNRDDGQELTNVAVSPDGKTVIYVRGGDHDANWPAEAGLQPDPDHSPEKPKLEILSLVADGASTQKPKLLAEGDAPVISPRGDRVAFVKDKAIWVVPLNGNAAAKAMFFARGTSTDPTWSPNGDRLAFVSDRGDHSFIGIVGSDSAPIQYLTPSTSRDFSPRWSPDGSQIAFVRMPGSGGAPETLLDLHPDPWAIWVASSNTLSGHRVWQSPNTLRGSAPGTDGGANLAWGAGNRLVFLSDVDGWPHLYSVGATGGAPLLLTPGPFMTEFISMTPDRSAMLYSANTGATAGDHDRRHIFRVPVDRATPVALTSGSGIEWMPQVTGDGRTVAFIGAGAQKPMLAKVVAMSGGTAQSLAEESIPSDFPTSALVIPKSVTFKAPDGTTIHGQLFESAENSVAKKPGIVFVHGGPPRQMLLGWHYMDYYSNSYAVNQYLANHGYVVLSVNYRLGIGYGHDFHNPPHAGPWGASEYQDVKAGAEYLRALPHVDAQHIGIWGGSYGGYLTAMALAHDSEIFKAGVDMHGVHNWITEYGGFNTEQLKYEQGDLKKAMAVAWKSSPVSAISTWKSPVLLIQGDDDRNVYFHETVDLARRLSKQGVSFEELVIPDEIHGFLRHQSWFRADSATAAYFDKQFKTQ
ncbi:MAG: prolyl oligopeptidase family serine peptidase [Gemmatimonadaceae bacterium]